MPRNGSGTYTLPAGNPVVTGTIISSTTQNTTMSDVATALTNSIAKDGQTVPTANLPMGGFKLTNLAAGTANGDSLRYEQLVGAYLPLSGGTLTGLLNLAAGADIASATTVDLTAATGNVITITGTTAVTAFTMNVGQTMLLVAEGALPLTYNATTMNIVGGASITATAGDRFLVFKDIDNVIRVCPLDPVKLVSGTITALSGTAVGFTGIPSWAKRITFMYYGSTNGSSAIQIQIGDSGGYETTGYTSSCGLVTTTINTTRGATSTTGILTVTAVAAAEIHNCTLTANLADPATNTWLFTGTCNEQSAGNAFFSSGRKSLTGTLDRIQVTMVNGTDAFDAGSCNIIYE